MDVAVRMKHLTFMEQLDGMHVHIPTAHTDAIRFEALFDAIVLGHDEFAYEPAALADVDVPGPVPIVGELILRKAPQRRFLAHGLGHGGVGHQEPKVTGTMIAVRAFDFRTTCAAGFD